MLKDQRFTIPAGAAVSFEWFPQLENGTCVQVLLPRGLSVPAGISLN
jgi:hypothetical protein